LANEQLGVKPYQVRGVVLDLACIGAMTAYPRPRRHMYKLRVICCWWRATLCQLSSPLTGTRTVAGGPPSAFERRTKNIYMLHIAEWYRGIIELRQVPAAQR